MSFYAIINSNDKLKVRVVHRETYDTQGEAMSDHFAIKMPETTAIVIIRIFQEDDELFAMRRLQKSIKVKAGCTVTFDWTLGIVAS